MTAAQPIPFKYDRFEDCPDAKKHTKQPDGYVDRALWSERKLKTHAQEQCPTCGFWVVWKRKKGRTVTGADDGPRHCYKIRGDRSMFLCGDLGEPCRWCGDVSDILCDWPTMPGLTCSAAACSACAHHVEGQGVDFCPDHAADGADFTARGGDVRHIPRMTEPSDRGIPLAVVTLTGFALILGMLSPSFRRACNWCGRGPFRVDRDGEVGPHKCRAMPPDKVRVWKISTADGAALGWANELEAKRAHRRGLVAWRWTPPETPR